MRVTDVPILFRSLSKIWLRKLFSLPALLLAAGLVGCASPMPLREYTLGKTAMNAARRANAARFAPGFWSQAEEAYALAEQLFNRAHYDEAKIKLVEARQLAEKAEEMARRRRIQSPGGDW